MMVKPGRVLEDEYNPRDDMGMGISKHYGWERLNVFVGRERSVLTVGLLVGLRFGIKVGVYDLGKGYRA